MKKQPKVGLVLSSGGTHGFAEIGALKKVYEAGVRFDFVAGCSVGSLVGACIAAGKTPKSIQKIFVEKKLVSLIDPVIGKPGFVKGEKLVEHVLKFAGVRLFNELKIPFVVNATNINSGTEKVFKQGLLFSALGASISVPGIFVPKKIGNDFFVDGAVSNPIPIHLLPGCDYLFVIDVSSEIVRINEKSTPAQVLTQSFIYLQTNIGKRILEHYKKKGNVIVIAPKISDFAFFEIRKKFIHKMILEGEHAAEKVLNTEFAKKIIKNIKR